MRKNTKERETELFEKNLESFRKFNKSSSVFGYFEGQRDRYIQFYRLIENYLDKKYKILDVGSKPPYFLATLKSIGYDIEGIDMNPHFDREIIKKNNLEIKKCDIEKDRFPYKKNEFDIVLFSEVFEHLYLNPLHTIKEIKRVLKKEGKLILTTPNAYSVKRLLQFFRGRGFFGDPYEEFSMGNELGYKGHLREYSLGEITNFLEKEGFKILKKDYFFVDHVGLRNSRFLKSIVKIVYSISSRNKSHLIIIAKK